MKNPLFAILFLQIISACTQPAADATNQPNPFFSTTPPSRLYFKNMRSYYYQQRTMPHTRTDLYTLKTLPAQVDYPMLIPIIADNWMQDEAYLLLQRNNHPAWATDTVRFRWQDPQSGQYGFIDWSENTMRAQYELAETIVQQLSVGHKLSIIQADSSSIPVFEEKEYIANFLKTMADYKNLTEQTRKVGKK